LSKCPNNLYESRYEDTIIEMGVYGSSISEFCASIPICVQTYYNWLDRYPSFKKASQLATTLSQAYWIKMGQDNINNPDFNTSLYHLQLGSRFGISKQRKIRVKFIDAKDVLGSLRKILKSYETADIGLGEFDELVKALIGVATIKEREEIAVRVEAIERRLMDE